MFDNDRTPREVPGFGRNGLAQVVVIGSFLTIFIFATTLVTLSHGYDVAFAQATEKAFNVVMPVIAGWVGTVLAFYFSAASQERTAQSLDRAIAQSNDTSESPTIGSKMIALNDIQGLQKLEDEGHRPENITLKSLLDIFQTTSLSGIQITRLVFVEKSVFRYILHISTLNDFIANSDPAKYKTPGNPSFADLLADDKFNSQISKLVVFVSAKATLSEAKKALDAVPKAQDVIVTATGTADSPMLGWLTNVDLYKASGQN